MSQILVVDDEPAIRDFVRAFLEDEGYRVAVGRNGDEALRAIRAQHPDLVLMDIMMPGVDGREVVRVLHEHRAHAAIPVILMSAAVSWDQSVDGPIQFLRKPFDLDQLLGMIRAALACRSAAPGPPAGFQAPSTSVAARPAEPVWSTRDCLTVQFT